MIVSAASICVSPLSMARLRMIDDLRCLTVRDECGDRHQISVARSETGTEPEIEEQDVGSVLNDSGSHLPVLLFNARRTLLLGFFVEGQQSG